MKAIALTIAAALACGVAACTEDRREARPADSTITVEVQKELNEEGVRGTIVVTSANGIVTLSGTVPDIVAKNLAEDVAKDVDGVDRVVNNLRTTMAGDAPAPPVVNPDAAPMAR